MEINIVPKFVDKAATPVAQSVGNSIAGVWDLVFGNHVSLWLKKQEFKHQKNYEDFVNKTNTKIESIPEENLQEPEMHILGPAIEASKYYIDSEELREMFANLIAASVDSRNNEKSHPSFVEIIKQLSPIDASVLKNFTFNDEYPIVRIKVVNANQSYKIVYEHIMNFQKTNDFEKYIAPLSNLQRLGIVDIDYVVSLSHLDLYNYVEQHPAYLKATDLLSTEKYNNSNFNKITFDKGLVSLTPLGRNFVITCCTKPSN